MATQAMRIKRNRKHPVELRGSIDHMVLSGKFSAMLGDSHGRPLWDKPLETLNTVVTSGRSWVLKHIMSGGSAGVSSQIITAVAVGTVTTAPATSDTALLSEVGRKVYTTETDNSGSSAPKVTWAATFATDEGNGNLGEFGIFNVTTANAGTMLARATTATFSKTTSNTLTVSYTLSI